MIENRYGELGEIFDDLDIDKNGFVDEVEMRIQMNDKAEEGEKEEFEDLLTHCMKSD